MRALLLGVVLLVLAGACIGLMSLREPARVPQAGVTSATLPPPVPARVPTARVTMSPEDLITAVDRRYRSLLDESALNDSDKERLREMLIERQIVTNDAVNNATARGLDLRTDLAAIRPDVEKAQAGVDAKIRARFGETFFARYRDYDESMAERNTVARLQRMLGPTMSPLNPDQTRDMVRVLRHFHGADAGGGLGRLIYGGINYNARVTDETLKAAANVLSATQLEKLRQLMVEQERSDVIAQQKK